MASRVNVQEQVAYIILAVRIHIMINELRIFSRHICIGKDKFWTLRLVNAHCKETSLSIFAFLTNAVVINLFVG